MTVTLVKVLEISAILQNLKADLQNMQDLNNDERTVIFWRFRVSVPKVFATTGLFVCLHHKVLLLQNFSQRFKKCCNIFSQHPSKSLPAEKRVVTLEIAKNLHPIFPAVVPGHKMCSRCFTHAKSEKEYTSTTSEILTVNAVTSTDDANTSTDNNTSTDDIINLCTATQKR